MIHRFEQAVKDSCYPPDGNAVFLTSKPNRWDEYLDLDCAIFIAHSCEQWTSLSMELWKSGLSNLQYLRLIEETGEVHKLRMEDGTLSPAPKSKTWTLLLNWTHPDEGWRSRLPLWGKAYIVTRQSRKSQAVIERLQELGARAFALPTLEFIAPDSSTAIEDALGQLASFHWLIFTSPNGVEYFFSYLKEQGLDNRGLGKANFACIGSGTAKALGERGFKCDLLPKSFVAEGLLEEFDRVLGENLTSLKVLIPRAQEAREVLPQTLAARGADVVVAPVYKTVQPSTSPDYASFITAQSRVLFTSSSTVKNWLSMTGNNIQPCFCIGPVTAQTAEEAGFQILGSAKEHSIKGLLELVLETDGAVV